MSLASTRGLRLGGPKLTEARERASTTNKALAAAYAANVLPRNPGDMARHQIVKALKARGITPPRGGQRYAKSVSNVLACA